MKETHDYHKAPDTPFDGQIFLCQCGYKAEFVMLDSETREGEWVRL